MFKPLGPQKRYVFSSLRRYGSDGQSCHVPGVLAIKIVPKGSQRAPFCCTFWRVGSKVSFSLLFVWFSGGSDPRSARARAVETQFAIFGVPSKGVSFLLQFSWHFFYIRRRNFLKRHFKIELETKSCKSVSFLHFGSFGYPFGHLMGRLFLPLGRGCPQKGKVFSSLGAWNLQRWCLTLSGATGASDISCFLEPGA